MDHTHSGSVPTGREGSPPSDTASQHTRWLGFHQHLLVSGVPGEPQSECFVADALNQDDLRSALEELSPDLGSVPEDQNDVDLIVMWVWERKHADWPRMWRESDTFSPCIDGCIVASIQAQDLAAGRETVDRPLKDYQREWLARWEGQSAHENP